MTGWLIALAVVLLIAAMPVGAIAFLRGGQFALFLKIGPLRIKIAVPPGKKRKAEPKETPDEAGEPKAPKRKLISSPQGVRDIAAIAVKTLRRFTRALKIRKLGLYISIGSNDAAKTAITSGRTCALTHTLLPVLRHNLRIRSESIEISPDFRRGDTDIAFYIDISAAFGRLIAVVFAALGGVLVYYLKHKNKEKAV
jgi:hypothetical protein